MTWIPGTYGFDTRQQYDAEVARKAAAGIPLTQAYIPPPASTPAPTPAPTPAAQQTPQPQQQPVQQQQPQIIYQQVPQQQQSYQQDPQINALIQQMQGMIQNQPTVESIMNSPAFQQMQQAIQGQMDQSMKGARADLAARGVLGQGSTPAADRIGQVAGHYGQQLGSLVPSMMGTAQQMHQGNVSSLQGLVNLLSGLDQQDWQRGITEAQTMLPYTRLTAGQKAELANTLIMNVPALRGYSPEQVMEWLDSSGMGV